MPIMTPRIKPIDTAIKMPETMKAQTSNDRLGHKEHEDTKLSLCLGQHKPNRCTQLLFGQEIVFNLLLSLNAKKQKQYSSGSSFRCEEA